VIFSLVSTGSDFATCVENIDIGGPSMIRSAAKNNNYVAVLTSPSQYTAFAKELQSNVGSVSLATRRQLAAVAFSLTSKYDTSVANFLAGSIENCESSVLKKHSTPTVLTETVTVSYQPMIPLKYGCNPHQQPSAILGRMGEAFPFKVLNGVPGR
jgi:phosphoribosylaminoimidazolecarboxamide formyltransferase / IMP cyclohydrolase